MSIIDVLKGVFSKADIPSAVSHLERAVWIPVVGDSDGEVTDSKFAGIPYLPEGETWPICPNCNDPMSFLLQLNQSSLPDACKGLWGEGPLQFFYCTSIEPPCDVDCQAFFPFAKSDIVRIVKENGSHVGPLEPISKESFPAKAILGWTQAVDFPNWEEMGELDIKLTDPQVDWMGERYPLAGEKLLGWPYWVQGVEYPNCPECDARMRLLFQIDSDKNLPVCWGDVGVGHITQCPNHLNVLTFAWACS